MCTLHLKGASMRGENKSPEGTGGGKKKKKPNTEEII
jgi:hypothetical protein